MDPIAKMLMEKYGYSADLANRIAANVTAGKSPPRYEALVRKEAEAFTPLPPRPQNPQAVVRNTDPAAGGPQTTSRSNRVVTETGKWQYPADTDFSSGNMAKYAEFVPSPSPVDHISDHLRSMGIPSDTAASLSADILGNRHLPHYPGVTRSGTVKTIVKH